MADLALRGDNTAEQDERSRPDRFFNRELSWLDFNDRVLQLAEDDTTPLLERLKFCAIWSSNLDEFFMVRVAGLHDLVDAGIDSPGKDGLNAAETIARIRDVASGQQARVCRTGAHAHLATVNRNGSPQQTMVWVGIEDGELCVPALTPRRKLDNVRREPRVALTFESQQGDDATGLRFYLAVRGRGRITEGGAPALLRHLAPRYLGPGVKFPRGDNPPEGWILRIAPERIHGYGPWTES